MDTAARPRSKFTTDDMLEIVSKIHSHIYGGNTIRVLDDEGERWIVFADICKALGYKNPNHESKKVRQPEKKKLEIGLKNTLAVCINQRGLLSFTLFSNKRETAAFRRWADTEIFGNGGD